MTWHDSCDMMVTRELPSVIIDKEETPPKGSFRTVFLVAGTALAALLLFIFSPGFFPGNAASRSRGADATNIGHLEKKVAELDRKLAEFHGRLTVVEEMDKHVRKINHDIEEFSAYYHNAEKSRNETFAQLTGRVDDLQKKGMTSPEQTRHQKNNATPSRPDPPPEKTDKGEKNQPIKTNNNDTHISSAASPATNSIDNSDQDSAAIGSTAQVPASTGNTDKKYATTIAAVAPAEKTASTRPPRAIKKISKKTLGKKRVDRFHKVRPGETLFRIGRRYNLTVTRLMKMNSLTSGAIYIGQRLKVGTTVAR